MQTVRSYIKEIIRETRFRQMAGPKFSDLRGQLLKSSFLDSDPEADLDEDGDWTSPAASSLRDDLNDYFDDKFGNGVINAVVDVDMMPTGDKAEKDSVLKGATYYYDGFHNIQMILANLEGVKSFREVPGAAQKIYEVVLHELLHMQQFMKFSRGNPTEEKWEEFNKRYSELGGPSKMGEDYFFYEDEGGLSELETFSLQIAAELLDSLGKSAAVKLLQKNDPDGDQLRKYSSSYRDIEKKASIGRPELRDMVKRARQYAKRLS